MITALLGLIILVVAYAVPIGVASRRGAFFATDIALLVCPIGMFAISAAYLRETSILFGWLVYPFEVSFASALLLNVRVLVIDRFSRKLRFNSALCLCIACAAALFAGLVVPVGRQ
jgi:hypothetical protein